MSLRSKVRLSNSLILRDMHDKEQARQRELGHFKKYIRGESENFSFGSLNLSASDIGIDELKPHQIEGVRWLANLDSKGLSGILGDEMGLGKTIQCIGTIRYIRSKPGGAGPILIFMPKSTLMSWKNEFSRWYPSARVLVFHGNPDEREEMIQSEFHDLDVCLTTYELLLRHEREFSSIVWRCLVVDEAHRMKNRDSRFSRAVRGIKSRFNLLMTGTPLQNNLDELLSLLNFVVCEFFSAQSNATILKDDDTADETRVKLMHRLLHPFLLRRLKKDVIKLPEMEEYVLYVPLVESQMGIYRSLLEKNSDLPFSNLTMQLRKCCNHPYLFRSGFDVTEDLVYDCGKMLMLDALLERLRSQGSRVLIFSQMTSVLDIIEDLCELRDYDHSRLDGSTDNRQQVIDEFNAAGSSKFVFCISTRAGGTGLTLTGADVCIIYDSDWNPQQDLQAMARVHRIGQRKAVKVFRFVTEGTVEEVMLHRAHSKLQMNAVIMEKDTKEETMRAIRFGADKVLRATDAADINVEYVNKLIDAAKPYEHNRDMFDFRQAKVEQPKAEQTVANEKCARPSTPPANPSPVQIGKRKRNEVSYVADEELPLQFYQLPDEKNKGFEDWTRSDYKKFLLSLQKRDRKDFRGVAEDIGKSPAVTARYLSAFWKRGPSLIPNFDELCGKFFNDAAVFELDALRLFMKTKKDHLSSWQVEEFTVQEDMFLLQTALKESSFDADIIFRAVRASDACKFNWPFRNKTAAELKARVDTLLLCVKKAK